MENIIYTTPTSIKAQKIIRELNCSLNKITGDRGTSSYNPEDYNPVTDRFMVITEGEETIACGGFRIVDEYTIEMKRVYSKKRGTGKVVVKSLEKEAVKMGYKDIILSTRRVNKVAVNFYKKMKYKEIEPYGKYKYRPISICLGRTIG